MKKIILALSLLSISTTSLADFSTIGNKEDLNNKKEGVFSSNKRISEVGFSINTYSGTNNESEFDTLKVDFEKKLNSTTKYGFETSLEYGLSDSLGGNAYYGEAKLGLTYERPIADRLSVTASIGGYHSTYYRDDKKIYDNTNMYAKTGISGELSDDLKGRVFYQYRDLEDTLFKSKHSFGIKLNYNVAKNCTLFIQTELSSDVDSLSVGTSYRF